MALGPFRKLLDGFIVRNWYRCFLLQAPDASGLSRSFNESSSLGSHRAGYLAVWNGWISSTILRYQQMMVPRARQQCSCCYSSASKISYSPENVHCCMLSLVLICFQTRLCQLFSPTMSSTDPLSDRRCTGLKIVCPPSPQTDPQNMFQQ